MLISSHRLNEVSALVNRVVEMDMGKVVLDDRVADDVSLSGRFACRISIKRSEAAFAKAMLAWNFATSATAGMGGRCPGTRSPALHGHDVALCGADQRLFAPGSRRWRHGELMDRRRFIVAGFALTPLAAALSACGKSGACRRHGGDQVDRDTCVRCSMVISDRRFAAEMRGGEKNIVFKFDDIGCAVFWMRTRPRTIPG